jgi:hypothetical protein
LLAPGLGVSVEPTQYAAQLIFFIAGLLSNIYLKRLNVKEREDNKMVEK